MLQNKEIPANCYCYSDNRNLIVEWREFEEKITGTIDIRAQEIIFLLKGNMCVTEETRNETCRLSEGEFVFMPIGSKLRCSLPENSALLIVRLIGEVPECHVFRINKRSGKSECHGIYPLKTNDRLQLFLSGLLATIGDGLKCRNYIRLEISRLLYLIHAYYSHEECMKFFSPINTADVEFSEFVRLNHAKYRTFKEMASVLNMSSYQFSQRFRQSFGENPRDWLQREKANRVYLATSESDKQFKEIAMEHHMLPSNFFRYCQKNFGKGPGRIREHRLRERHGGSIGSENPDENE